MNEYKTEESEFKSYNNTGQKVLGLAVVGALAVGSYFLFKDSMKSTVGVKEGIEAFEKGTHPMYNKSPTLDSKLRE